MTIKMVKNVVQPKFSMNEANVKILTKAVILCAGKSTRTYPLTVTQPKALLKAANKSILSLLLNNLPQSITEVILVVNYKKEIIKEEFGNNYKTRKIIYVEQKETKGTGDALLEAEQAVGTENQFLVLYGDDYFEQVDFLEISKESNAILVQEVEHPELYGVIIENENNQLITIEEKPLKPKSKLVNTGVYVLPKEIFQHLKKIKKTKRGEYELTDGVVELAKKNRMKIIRAKNWIPVTYPWHLLDVNKHLLAKLKFRNDGKIEPGVTIHGAVEIGKGSILKSGAYIEGPVMIGENCVVGPNCYIRSDTTVGNNVKIGNAVEIKSCIIGSNVCVGHLSYIGDSVIGDKVNLGAGTIAANLRHDNSNIKSKIGFNLVDSGRRKLGTIVGDNVHTGIHTAIYPGRKLWPNATTLPGEVVNKDKIL